MSKIKFVKNPRSIMRKRNDSPSSLFVPIPKKIVVKWAAPPSEITEFLFVREAGNLYLKLRRIMA